MTLAVHICTSYLYVTYTSRTILNIKYKETASGDKRKKYPLKVKEKEKKDNDTYRKIFVIFIITETNVYIVYSCIMLYIVL